MPVPPWEYERWPSGEAYTMEERERRECWEDFWSGVWGEIKAFAVILAICALVFGGVAVLSS